MDFQAVSGLSINLATSEMVRLGLATTSEDLVSALDCRLLCLLIKYLGLPLGANLKEARMWELVMERFEKRLASWKRALLSKGERFTLIKSTLSNFLIYFMS